MQIIETEIADVKILAPKKHGDSRGFFSETYSRRAFKDVGIDIEFVQDNQSLSAQSGCVRALHYQLPPMAQAKLVRVIRGSILDVAVDIRRNSKTFGRHVGAILSSENWRQMFVPEGFAHGFATLEPDTEVVYKVSNYYSPQHERGIRWNDPQLAIDWNVTPEAAILSKRDTEHPFFSAALDLF